MNKIAVLTGIMFAELTAVLAGFLFSILTPYEFIIKNYPVFLLILSLIFVGAAVSVILLKKADVGIAPLIFTALLPMLVEAASFFCMLYSENVITNVIVFGLLGAAAVCVTVTVNKRAAKLNVVSWISLTLSVLLIVPLTYFSFFIQIFGNISENTVVQELTSPNGTYTVQVVDSDQGALGGDTFVYTYSNKGRVNLGLLEFGKDRKHIYRGEYGEYRNMNMYWISDNELSINDKIYVVD